MTNPADKNGSSTALDYVQVTLGKTRLLFPSTEVLSLEAMPETGTVGSIGVVRLNGTELPVYNFDEELQLLHGSQNSRPACACLGNGRTAYGLLCDKTETVDGASLRMIELPPCMRSANTPVQFLATQGTRVLCVSSVERLAGLIEVFRQHEAGP